MSCTKHLTCRLSCYRNTQSNNILSFRERGGGGGDRGRIGGRGEEKGKREGERGKRERGEGLYTLREREVEEEIKKRDTKRVWCYGIFHVRIKLFCVIFF